ncbi:MAG: hypothetical protein LBE09_09165 [Christensenellaceae bacterium]|jgi:hypothetical protein|nr:hypothetical protein [Christensenellaceae bacterium]
MAQASLTNHKQFSSRWTERDEAIFIDLLKRKINELRYEIARATSPYIRAKLKTRRSQYRGLLAKVETGNYNSDILAAQMAAYQGAKNKEAATYNVKSAKIGKYIDSYEGMDFDFDAYFRKSRYFGAALPIVLLIFAIIFTALVMFSIIVPATSAIDMDTSIGTATYEMGLPRLTGSAVLYFKLTDEKDFLVPNDGAWPNGTFAQPENAIEQGKVYTDANGNLPASVYLHKDLNMTSVSISGVDIVKAAFYTPLLKTYSIAPVENILFKTEKDKISWYYRLFISDREDALKIQKDENGEWNAVNIVNSLATYATIVFFLIALLCCVLEVVINIVRIFTHTSRRFHAIPIILLISMIMVIICPVFSLISGFDNNALTTAITDYFAFNWDTFISASGFININYVMAILCGIVLLYILIPKLFKNRAFKAPTHVPKGNRAHTFPGQKYPTPPGKLPDRPVKGAPMPQQAAALRPVQGTARRA